MITRAVIALCCGVPVIHPPFTEVSPLVARYDAGWLVDPGDPAALDAVLDEVIAHPKAAEAKAAGARRLWAEVLDPVVATAPLAGMVRGLLAGGS
jgi:glycosyltransferase involved in cell wall biosynthesis